jgi:hypothetical protein
MRSVAGEVYRTAFGGVELRVALQPNLHKMKDFAS